MVIRAISLAWSVAIVSACALAGTASAGSTFPGQNGQIAFQQAPPGGDDEIFAIGGDGQGQTPLTANDVGDFDPSYSADGERIAFARANAAGTGSTIVVMDHDGQNEVPLTSGAFSDRNPSFSPDGQRIVFQRFMSGSDAEIFVMGVDGQNITPLTSATDGFSDGSPSFSPDGQRILFVRSGGTTGSDLFVMGPNGESPTPLTSSPDGDNDPSWSPDGEKIVFQRNEAGMGGAVRIYLIDANGGTPTPFRLNPFSDFDPSFSPDGQRIAFGAGVSMTESQIFAMDANGQNPVPLTANPGDASATNWQALNPPQLEVTGPQKQKSVKSVDLTAECPTEDCTLVVDGQLRAPKKPARSAAAAKAKLFALGPLTAELQAGVPTALALQVPKKARKLLKRGFEVGKKGTASVELTATDDLGASTADAHQVKLKRKKK
jgi:WD40-like Beta Propeller Repeat